MMHLVNIRYYNASVHLQIILGLATFNVSILINVVRRGIRGGSLVIFSNAFQGHYKDGTNGTRDLCFFPTVYTSGPNCYKYEEPV